MKKRRRWYSEKLEPVHYIAYGGYAQFRPKQFTLWGEKVEPKPEKKKRKY